MPQRLLSDNGLAFNPTRRGVTGKFVNYLIDVGVKPITGKPDKPATQGKNERFHQTLQKWLNARPPARTILALQALVDEFDAYYNHERVHQALDGKTPMEAWQATDPAPPPTPRGPHAADATGGTAEGEQCPSRTTAQEQGTVGAAPQRGQRQRGGQAERAGQGAQL